MSISLISACACGLRTVWPQSIPAAWRCSCATAHAESEGSHQGPPRAGLPQFEPMAAGSTNAEAAREARPRANAALIAECGLVRVTWLERDGWPASAMAQKLEVGAVFVPHYERHGSALVDDRPCLPDAPTTTASGPEASGGCERRIAKAAEGNPCSKKVSPCRKERALTAFDMAGTVDNGRRGAGGLSRRGRGRSHAGDQRRQPRRRNREPHPWVGTSPPATRS